MQAWPRRRRPTSPRSAAARRPRRCDNTKYTCDDEIDERVQADTAQTHADKAWGGAVQMRLTAQGHAYRSARRAAAAMPPSLVLAGGERRPGRI